MTAFKLQQPFVALVLIVRRQFIFPPLCDRKKQEKAEIGPTGRRGRSVCDGRNVREITNAQAQIHDSGERLVATKPAAGGVGAEPEGRCCGPAMAFANGELITTSLRHRESTLDPR